MNTLAKLLGIGALVVSGNAFAADRLAPPPPQAQQPDLIGGVLAIPGQAIGFGLDTARGALCLVPFLCPPGPSAAPPMFFDPEPVRPVRPKKNAKKSQKSSELQPSDYGFRY